MMNLTRSHMTILSFTYKSQMMVKVKFVNSIKYQNVTIKIKRREYIIKTAFFPPSSFSKVPKMFLYLSLVFSLSLNHHQNAIAKQYILAIWGFLLSTKLVFNTLRNMAWYEGLYNTEITAWYEGSHMVHQINY